MPHDDPLFRDALFRTKQKKGGYRIVDPPTPRLEALVADTHAHLEMLDDVPLALARSSVHGLGFVCDIADVCEDALAVYALADQWRDQARVVLPGILANGDALPPIPRIRVAIGCHPHNAKRYSETAEAVLLEHLCNPLTCALGEVGLDFHYDFSPRDVQREVFRRQVSLAHVTGLPLILHLREAHEEALVIMEEEGFPEAGTLLHCFNLDEEALAPWVRRGCFIAFGGPLTFKKSDSLRAAALLVPRDRVLTETDAPFMTPEPMRGMRCAPEHAIFTAERLAAVFACEPGEDRERFLAQLYHNALGLLDREPTTWQRSEGEGRERREGREGQEG